MVGKVFLDLRKIWIEIPPNEDVKCVKKAESPSISTKIAKVAAAQKAKMGTSITAPVQLLENPILVTMFHKTSDNWEWASDKAHNRKYEAVCETLPRTYSMV